jgi:hypothetical protein
VNPQTVQVDDLGLVALPTAVICADLFVRFTLTEWSLRELMADAAEVAQHLVAAVVAQTIDMRAPSLLTLRLRLSGANLVIEVHDRMPYQPVMPAALANLTTGIFPAPGRGNIIWCELPLPGGTNADSVRLPRRERRPSPAARRLELAGEPTGPDPDVLERLLHGLGGSTESRH